MDKTPQLNVRTTSNYFLEGLNEIGVEYLFCNFGTDHAPLIEEMARWSREGRAFPKTILCPHENTAMHMAAGFANVTGRGQAVMVHVDAGTANCAMGAHNLRRTRVPVLLMAGKAPYTVRGERVGARDNYVHFIQEPFDQGSIVRNYVKWEWTLPSGVITKEVLRRAHSVAHSDPPGPVYLMLPRETLAEEWDTSAVRSFPQERYGAVHAGLADPAIIATLADRLIAAEHPIVVTSYAGRNAAAPALLDELAHFAGLRVYESHPIHVNIPRDSDCFAGFAPGEALPKTDVGVLIDVDVPWIPTQVKENDAIYWGHIDIDVIKEDFPMWGFASNLRMQANSAFAMRQLLDALQARATPAFKAKVAARLKVITQESRERREKVAKAATNRGMQGAVNPAYACAEVAKHLAPTDIIVNEAVRNVPTVMNHVQRTEPGTYHGFAGGGLGCSGGIALGAKLARPAATVVQFVGDGGFYFNNPSSLFSVSKQYRLPILSVVLDNSGWSAVKEATLRMYSQGEAFNANDFQAGLQSDVDFAKVAESVGGHGERVRDPDELPAAVERAMVAVRGGKPTVLHVKIPSI
jgi:acetolactate synthase I/II/III large subunit